jgi:hypothetical protein
VRTIEDSVHFVNGDFHPVIYAMRDPQTLRSRHPTFLLR